MPDTLRPAPGHRDRLLSALGRAAAAAVALDPAAAARELLEMPGGK